MAKLPMKGLATHTPDHDGVLFAPEDIRKGEGRYEEGSALAIKVAVHGLDRPAYAWGPSSTPGPGTAIAQRRSGQPSQGWMCVQSHASSGPTPTLSFWMEPDSPIKMHGGRDFPSSPVVRLSLLQGAGVRSLVVDLRSHLPGSLKPKHKKKAMLQQIQ